MTAASNEVVATESDGTAFGEVQCHCSEDDGIPDVGVSLGLGDGKALWIGETLLRDGANCGMVFHDGSKRIVAPFPDGTDWQEAADILRHHVGPALTRAHSDPRPVAEPWPGYTADQDRRRVVTLATLGLMLSAMAGGDAAEVAGFDAADLYAEVLMALAIEDADNPDIVLEVARDHPEGNMLATHSPASMAGEETCPVCNGDCGSANPPVMFCPMRDILATHSPTPVAVPHGYVLVPVEPTEAMIQAVWKATLGGSLLAAERAARAMIAAAHPSTQEG